jgi:hypothetical protein
VFVWGHDFFETVVKKLGRLVCLDFSTTAKDRFDVARVLVDSHSDGDADDERPDLCSSEDESEEDLHILVEDSDVRSVTEDAVFFLNKPTEDVVCSDGAPSTAPGFIEHDGGGAVTHTIGVQEVASVEEPVAASSSTLQVGGVNGANFQELIQDLHNIVSYSSEEIMEYFREAGFNSNFKLQSDLAPHSRGPSTFHAFNDLMNYGERSKEWNFVFMRGEFQISNKDGDILTPVKGSSAIFSSGPSGLGANYAQLVNSSGVRGLCSTKYLSVKGFLRNVTLMLE